MAELYATATEYLANALTFSRGSVADITSVGVYHDENPSVVPAVGDFTAVHLVDDPATDPLASGNNIDVLSLVGPKAGSDLVLMPGDYQRWVLVQTADEDIIRAVDTVTIT